MPSTHLPALASSSVIALAGGVNAEAGPSSPHPHPHEARPRTPPDTPTKAARRRSWFGFGFGGASSTVAAASTSTSSPSKNRHDGRTPVVELELSDRSQGAGELGSAGSTIGAGAGAGAGAEVDGGVEELTIDARPVEHARGDARGKRRSKADAGEGEAVRLDDLGLRRAGSRSSTIRVSDPSRHAEEQERESPLPHTNAAPMPDPHSTDRSNLSTRSSSVSLHLPRSSTEKRTPPLPIDRPLPALPPDPPSPPSTTATSAPPPAPILATPAGIVITPSSPRKARSIPQRGSSSMSNLKSEGPAKRSRSSSRTRLPKAMSRKSSLVGLGLPRALRGGDGGDGEPPPVPSKPVSVSSPHPSRSASPVPRIAFIEPEETEERGRKASGASEGREKGKRSRSLSGIFGRSPVVGPATAVEGGEDESGDKVEVLSEEGPGKMSGVLEWLGMKSKRRGSDGRALERGLSASGAALAQDSPAADSDTRAQETATHATRDANVTDSSDNTIVLGGQPRTSDPVRHSSDLYPTPTTHLPAPIAVPGSSRQLTASSSSSSLNVPLPDPSPSFISRQSSWVASPTREDEIIFSPPGAPWLDTPLGSPGRSGQASPLSPTPEAMEDAQQHSHPQGRARAWSDAPHPTSDDSPPTTRSAEPSPLLGSRPKLGSRTNSGNSAIIDRMKGVFAMSTSSKNRTRSKSLLPPDNRVDEFGAIQSKGRGRPSTAGSTSSTAPNASLLDLHGARRGSGDGHRSSRTSFTDTTRSRATTSTTHSVAQATTAPATAALPDSAAVSERPSRGSMDAGPPPVLQTRSRNRASTVSFASSAPNVAPSFAPPSPAILALGATPPRRRPSAISRISGGRLGSTPGSPKGLFPLPPRSSASSSAPGLSADEGGSTQSILLSPGASPRPSVLNLRNIATEGESVDDWLAKVERVVGSEDIAGVLASSADAFHSEALRKYMAQFDFTHQALDVALRKLLLKMSLPKETQQIDRVIEAFARRYEACEPDLFGNKDNTYVLAFSMMMLHTDAFNKHNKNKMTKADYVRNTRLDGVSSTVLEAFYDNITFTPFVYDHEPVTPGLTSGSRSRSGSDAASYFPTTPTSASTLGSASALTPRSGKTDVYALIATDALAALRVDVEASVPATSPLSCVGTSPALKPEALHDRFVSAGILRVEASPTKRKKSEETVLRVTKAGLLSRRDGPGTTGRRSKAKSWSVVLTGSQLLFFKDPFWAPTLLENARSAKRNERGQLLLPSVGQFVPDEVFPVKDCVAVYDGTPNTFHFHLPHRQYVMTASDEHEMNEWICLINYAAAFKSAGVRMRGSTMEREQAVLAGAAAASSFKREVVGGRGPAERSGGSSSGALHKFGAMPLIDGLPRPTEALGAPMGQVDKMQTASGLPGPQMTQETTTPSSDARIHPTVDLGEVVKDGGEQLEEVFDVVKAQLAAGGGAAARAVGSKAATAVSRGSRASVARTADIEAQIKHYETRLAQAEAQLSSRMTQARNLAILTPFQRSTRERLAAAVPPLAQRVRADRLQVARYGIYLLVLRADLERDEREFARVRHVALQAAAKSLRDPMGVKAVVQAETAGSGVGEGVPTLALPADADDGGDEGGGMWPRSPSPISLRSLGGHEYDRDDGNASDGQSVFGAGHGHAGGSRGPDETGGVMQRTRSEGPGPVSARGVGMGLGGGGGGGGARDAKTPLGQRPPFGRQASASSVVSSNGSFFGLGQSRAGQVEGMGDRLAPPTTG